MSLSTNSVKEKKSQWEIVHDGDEEKTQNAVWEFMEIGYTKEGKVSVEEKYSKWATESLVEEGVDRGSRSSLTCSAQVPKHWNRVEINRKGLMKDLYNFKAFDENEKMKSF